MCTEPNMGRQLGGKPTCIHTICGMSRCYWIHTMPETLGWVFLFSFCFFTIFAVLKTSKSMPHVAVVFAGLAGCRILMVSRVRVALHRASLPVHHRDNLRTSRGEVLCTSHGLYITGPTPLPPPPPSPHRKNSALRR